MIISSRPYQHPDDFEPLSHFLSNLRADVRHTHILHPGDLTWQMFHMLSEYPPADLLQIWRDPHGQILAFVLLFPRFGGFELQIHADYRGSTLEVELLDWAEQRLSTNHRHSTLANAADTIRIRLLNERGYRADGDWLYLEYKLNHRLPEPHLPPGFVIRSLRGEQDADARAQVLAAAFEAPVQAERYHQFMRAPGYVPDLDLVAVASDSQFAAFAMCWVDRANRVGQFEPVGTASAFRRQGLGRAVLEEGLRRMQQRGAERVILIVEEADEPACALYHSVGFETKWPLKWYTKVNGA